MLFRSLDGASARSCAGVNRCLLIAAQFPTDNAWLGCLPSADLGPKQMFRFRLESAAVIVSDHNQNFPLRYKFAIAFALNPVDDEIVQTIK